MRSVLAEAGIESVVFGEAAAVLDWQLVTDTGIELKVRAADAVPALEVLRDARSEDGDSSEEWYNAVEVSPDGYR